MNLEIKLLSNRLGPNLNQIQIAGFQSAPQYNLSAAGTATSPGTRAFGDVHAPGADQFDLYVDSVYYGRFASGSVNVLTRLFPDTRFDMIGFNTLFGVPSFTARKFFTSDCTAGRRCTYYTQ